MIYYHNEFKNHKLSYQFLNSLFQGKHYKIIPNQKFYLYTNFKDFVIYCKYQNKFLEIQPYQETLIKKYAFITQNFKIFPNKNHLTFLLLNHKQLFSTTIETPTYDCNQMKFKLFTTNNETFLQITLNIATITVPENNYAINILNGSMPVDVYKDLLKQSNILNILNGNYLLL